jgi:hypothetical protein
MSAPALIAREGTSWESRGGNGEVVRLFGLWASCSALLAGAIGAGTVLAAGPVDARVGGAAALSVQPVRSPGAGRRHNERGGRGSHRVRSPAGERRRRGREGGRQRRVGRGRSRRLDPSIHRETSAGPSPQ